MSRFIALMSECTEPLNVNVIRSSMGRMLENLHAVDGTIEIPFPLLREEDGSREQA